MAKKGHILLSESLLNYRLFAAPTKALFVHATWKDGSNAATFVFRLDKIEKHFTEGMH